MFPKVGSLEIFQELFQQLPLKWHSYVIIFVS